jgi:hypothetical protein
LLLFRRDDMLQVPAREADTCALHASDRRPALRETYCDVRHAVAQELLKWLGEDDFRDG